MKRVRARAGGGGGGWEVYGFITSTYLHYITHDAK